MTAAEFGANTDITANALTADQHFWLILINLVFIFLFKGLLVAVAYKTIRMGHQLLVDGVKGEFKFNAGLSGAKADLVSASPGTFFVFLGIALLAAALYIRIEGPSENQEVTREQTQGAAATPHRASSGAANALPQSSPFSR